MLKGQNGIFFFDVTAAKNPKFLFSTKAVQSSMTDDFMPIENGGFLITQMGAADGTAPGRECPVGWRGSAAAGNGHPRIGGSAGGHQSGAPHGRFPAGVPARAA